MATAKQEDSDPLLDSVTCAICMEVLDDPRSLQCMHSYCRKCIQSTIDKHPDKKSFPCPICREDCPIPDQGAAGLKVNFFVNSVLDIAKDRSTSLKDEWHCDICFEEGEQVPAISKCLDCNEKLCKACNRAHKRSRNSKLHKILELSGDTSKDTRAAMDMLSKRTLYCQVHTQEPLKYFCKKDQLLICQDCFAFDHQGHQLENIEQTAKATLKDLSSVIDLGKQRSAQYETDINKSQIRKQDIEKNTDDVTSKLERDQQLVQAHVDAHFKALKAEVKAMGSAAVKNIVAHLAGLQFDKDAIDGTVKQLESLQEHGHSADIVDMIPEMNAKREVWSVPPVSSNGDLDIKAAVKESQLSDDGVVFANLEKHHILEKDCDNITVLDDDTVVTIGYTDREATFYDKSFNVKGTMVLPNSTGAWTNAGDNCFSIIEKNDTPQINIYNDEGVFQREIPLPNVETHDFVLTRDNDFVMFVGADSVVRIDSRTEKISLIDDTISKPAHGYTNIAVNSKNNIIYTCQGGIQCIKLDCARIQKLFEVLSGGGLWPCVDKKDNILIFNRYTCSVQILNPEGHFIKNLISPSTSNCQVFAIAPNSRGELLVAAFHDGSDTEICMFTLKYMSDDGQIF